MGPGDEEAVTPGRKEPTQGNDHEALDRIADQDGQANDNDGEVAAELQARASQRGTQDDSHECAIDGEG